MAGGVCGAELARSTIPDAQLAQSSMGGVSVMLRGAFSTSGPGPIRRIEEIMNKHRYRDIIADHLQDAADNLPLMHANNWVSSKTTIRSKRPSWLRIVSRTTAFK